MRQVETSRTLVFDDDVHAPAFFEALLCENMGLGRPENVELLFRHGQRSGRPSGPPPGGGFKTKIDRYCDLVTLNVFYKSSRVKQYLKERRRAADRDRRQQPVDLRCNRMLANLPGLPGKARAIPAGARHVHYQRRVPVQDLAELLTMQLDTSVLTVRNSGWQIGHSPDAAPRVLQRVWQVPGPGLSA